MGTHIMASSLLFGLVLCLATTALAAPGEDRKVNSCGCAKPMSTDRIVGGKEVSTAKKYPYQIWVQGLGACGGSIINKKYILSAAHCFGKPGQKDIKVTPNYNEDMANDLAIIKLTTEIQFSDKVRPVCLATDKAKDYTGQMAVVAGWGTTAAYNPGQKVPESPAQYILKETAAKVQKNSEENCQIATGGDTTTRMCAWTKNTGDCQGDSGGPLTVVEGGKFIQIGVVNYAAGCGANTPEGMGVYARITNFVDWIQKITADGEC